uniref:Uncharacterized protein n=1 Tax=Haptolina brevifila TaxID=156173 RepID=A0A7S2IJD9_9EUKA
MLKPPPAPHVTSSRPRRSSLPEPHAPLPSAMLCSCRWRDRSINEDLRLKASSVADQSQQRRTRAGLYIEARHAQRDDDHAPCKRRDALAALGQALTKKKKRSSHCAACVGQGTRLSARGKPSPPPATAHSTRRTEESGRYS